MTSVEKFNAAVKVIDSLPKNGPFQPSNELLLKFYAYQKQATEGPCNTEKPYFWDVVSKQKWTAWKSLGDMPTEEAMQNYVDELVKIIETMSYNEAISNFMDAMGPLYETVWLEEPDAEASGNSEKEMSDSSFEVIKQETDEDAEVNKIPVDANILQNANQAAEIAKHAMKTVIPSPLLTARSKKSQKANSGKSAAEKTSSSKKIASLATTSRLKTPKDSVLVSGVPVCSDNLVLKTKQFSQNIPSETLREILFISVISLQRSLEDVIKRLDKLEALIKVHSLNGEQCPHPVKNWTFFGLPHWATMFVILWPFISHWVTSGRGHKR